MSRSVNPPSSRDLHFSRALSKRAVPRIDRTFRKGDPDAVRSVRIGARQHVSDGLKQAVQDSLQTALSDSPYRLIGVEVEKARGWPMPVNPDVLHAVVVARPVDLDVDVLDSRYRSIGELDVAKRTHQTKVASASDKMARVGLARLAEFAGSGRNEPVSFPVYIGYRPPEEKTLKSAMAKMSHEARALGYEAKAIRTFTNSVFPKQVFVAFLPLED